MNAAPNQAASGSSGGDNHAKWLTPAIFGSIVLAFLCAFLAPDFAASLHLGGELFLRMLKMLVVPLVFTSVMCGVLGMGDVRKLGRPGAAAVGYYLMTTVIAVILGLLVVNVFQPGKMTLTADQEEKLVSAAEKNSRGKIGKYLSEETGLSASEVQRVLAPLPEGQPESPPSVTMIVENLVLMLVSDNLLAAAADQQLLPMIVFAIAFAAMLTTMREDVSSLTNLVTQSNAALMKFVMLLMYLAPIGIFCLVASRFGEAMSNGSEAFWAELRQIGGYFMTIIAGLGIHALVVLPLIYYIVLRKNPFRYLLAMAKALLTAFSTASSSATLPITLECAEEAGVSKRSTEFVVPLGATINMDGTALYEAGAALFIAQVSGADLSLFQQLIIAVTATLAAIGAAGIPEAGLITMLIVLNAVGLPLEYMGLILSVDWLLDRFRTTVNVFGDSVGAAVVEKAMPAS
ncbi:Proton glutamate symport protein [Stieleria bergensis]|uniref:Proton glutamate symport protein n=1 Tax=Stieleria bergensis TaxID=2528025 RepID=A0A517SU41_9BACT|nr:MAG: sodium:dicarboxylate symporter [Rhodopirellula sp. TMED11]QDT59644.1 Proton glutamate symport protein [Planctomycetes bacterium SV_7m_r]